MLDVETDIALFTMVAQNKIREQKVLLQLAMNRGETKKAKKIRANISMLCDLINEPYEPDGLIDGVRNFSLVVKNRLHARWSAIQQKKDDLLGRLRSMQ